MFYSNFLFTVINVHLNVLENSIGERQLGYSSEVSFVLVSDTADECISLQQLYMHAFPCYYLS